MSYIREVAPDLRQAPHQLIVATIQATQLHQDYLSEYEGNRRYLSEHTLTHGCYKYCESVSDNSTQKMDFEHTTEVC